MYFQILSRSVLWASELCSLRYLPRVNCVLCHQTLLYFVLEQTEFAFAFWFSDSDTLLISCRINQVFYFLRSQEANIHVILGNPTGTADQGNINRAFGRRNLLQLIMAEDKSPRCPPSLSLDFSWGLAMTYDEVDRVVDGIGRPLLFGACFHKTKADRLFCPYEMYYDTTVKKLESFYGHFIGPPHIAECATAPLIPEYADTSAQVERCFVLEAPIKAAALRYFASAGSIGRNRGSYKKKSR